VLLVILCLQPKDVKHAISDLTMQKTAVEDWSKPVAGIYPLDDKPPGSDVSRTNLEVIAGSAKKKLPILIDEDAPTEDFFMERTNRLLIYQNVCCLDPEGGSQKATSVVVVVVSEGPKIPKAFLMRSRAQRNFETHSCRHCPQIYRLRFFTYFLINE